MIKNEKEFDKIINQYTTKVDGRPILSKEKLKTAGNHTKNELIAFIVKKGGAIVIDLLNEDTDMAHLHCYGYLYIQKNDHFTFLCKSCHNVRPKKAEKNFDIDIEERQYNKKATIQIEGESYRVPNIVAHVLHKIDQKATYMQQEVKRLEALVKHYQQS